MLIALYIQQGKTDAEITAAIEAKQL